ncbi:centromere protein F [Pteronotus mesoamericanus]|uniref:centromere protein F n=1 Tax=Pteronotus mesoamericanus TaxID=1884717 RepID=UPI0023ED2F1B|nr:centromere protein F [Pteronotus parnellii mesoamericanus]
MSWAVEEWKEGLPSRALQKIQELEGQLDKLKKEKQQRQFQLETLEAVVQKEKQKVENEKVEVTNLKRENQSLLEVCENLEKAKQKISHELQVKESQVNFQEGQLSSTKKQIEKLEQELKRCKSELERSQKAAQSAHVSVNPCNTPQKYFTSPITPVQCYTGSKYEDLKEKYNKEVEERKRLEAEVKALQAKKANQVIPEKIMNHRDIARQQASSSVFSWQQEKTPSRLSSSALPSLMGRSFSACHTPGEEVATASRSALQAGQRDADSSCCNHSRCSPLSGQLKAQNQELRSKIGELELQLQGQEQKMKGQVNKCQELQLQLEKANMELKEKEKVSTERREALVRMTAQCDQASTKCGVLEEKLKKLSEDLSCQRQNADSIRCSLEEKLKVKEKAFQEELSRQERAFQSLERESAQAKGKLSEELQRVRAALGALQAQLEEVSSGKQQLEKKLEGCKQNFGRTEQALQASQTREEELRRSCEEMKKENSFLRSQSEQRAREVCHLQEELKKSKRDLSQSQNVAEEMRAKNASQESMLRDLQEKINQQENSLTVEKLKLALADLEKQRDCSQDLLKKREHHIEQLSEKLSKTKRESEALSSALELKKKEFEELTEEKTLFSHWKSENEQLIKQMESEHENLQSKISQLETCRKTQEIQSNEYKERVSTLEMERENLSAEVRNLHSVIDSQTVEVETQKQAYVELQQKANLSDQKHKKETENMCLKVSELMEQVEDLKQKLQLLSREITDKDQRYQDLHSEYESLRDLLKPGDPLVTREARGRRLLTSEEQSEVRNSFVDVVGEQGSMPSERGGGHVGADQSPENSALLQCLQLELQTMRTELESGNGQEGTQSGDVSGLKDCETDTEGKPLPEFYMLSTSENDDTRFQRALQRAIDKLHELETMCETLRVEKFESMSELNDSRSERITATSKMTDDFKKLLDAVKILNNEHSHCQDELVEEVPEGEPGEQQSIETSVFLNSLGDGNFYEHLTLSHKEVQMCFAELQDKFSCLQREHKLLHDQHSQMRTKMSELQSYVGILKAENSVLSMKLRSSQGDLVKEGKMEPSDGHSLLMSLSCVADSPSPPSLGELSFWKGLLEEIGETSLLKGVQGDVCAQQSDVEEASRCGPQEEGLPPEAMPPVPEKSVEELEILCEGCQQSLKEPGETVGSQEMMEEKAMEEPGQFGSSERKELDCLREQHVSEIEQCPQMPAGLTVGRESPLAAEEEPTEHLSPELGVAPLEPQCLDLSAWTVLGTDAEDALQGGSESCDTNGSEEGTTERKERTPKRDIHSLCDRIVVINGRSWLHSEVDTLSKEKKELDLMSKKMKEKIEELEFHQGECPYHSDIVETEVKGKRQLLQTLSSDVSELLKEKAYLQEQLQRLEKDSHALSLGKNELENQIRQLNNEKELLVRESESLWNKLHELEQEKLTATKSLEAAVMEKGEVAVRLSSTQDEVHQLRNGIEKLRVRIEADERKQVHVLEKLKESEHKNDLLQDKVENLERALQMAEENQEIVILDAENSKAEVETLKTQIESMTESLKALESDLVMIRSEKENRTKQLQEKEDQMSELDALLSSCKNLLEEKEQEKMQMREESKATVEMLERELEELNKEVAALCDNPETGMVPEQSLGFPMQGVQQLKTNIQKLKVWVDEAGMQQIQILGELQESKQQASLLGQTVEALEKELKESEKKHEHATQEAEDSKAELEKLKAKIEDLEKDLVNIRSEKENLRKKLQTDQEQLSELEILKSSFENQLQEKQKENIWLKEESKIVEERLQTLFEQMKEKLPALCNDQGPWKATGQSSETGQIPYLEHEKIQLPQGLDQTQSNYIILQSSVNGLIQEVEDGRQKLQEREEEIRALKYQIQEQEQLVSKLSQLEGELHVLKKQKAEQEQKIQRLQSKNDTLQDNYNVLQNSYTHLEKELELIKMEKVSFVEKVNVLTLRETELQREVHEMTQKMTDLKAEFSGEKHTLSKELNGMLEALKRSEGQVKELLLEKSDLRRSLDRIQQEQMEKEEKTREEIAASQQQLQEAEKKHHTLLLDTNQEHALEIQTYREKLTSAEECLRSQKVEIDLFTSSKEQLTESLNENAELLKELLQTKMDSQTYINQLKKEKESAQGEIKSLLRRHKLLEEEKALLQKELCHLEEAAQEKQKSGAVVDAHVDELMTEVKELKEALEVKNKEADEYLDKYCSLLISHEKLERAKEMLETQVARLSTQQSAPPVPISPGLKSVDQESPPVPYVMEKSPPVPCVPEKKVSSGQRKASGKRQRSSGIRENKGGTSPSTPDMFPKPSQKVVQSAVPPAEDAESTEFEPEGLPEVVKKGFADIPTGKTSPFILRRTTMATRTSPRLAAQKLPPFLPNLHKENQAEMSKPTAGGSRSQKVKVAQQSPADSDTVFHDPSARPLSANNLPKRQWAGSPREGLRSKRGCLTPSLEADMESHENCQIQ